jgi:hypothetical protein
VTHKSKEPVLINNYKITNTRGLSRSLRAGDGKIIVIKERRTVDSINSQYYVLYDEFGTERAVSLTPIIIQVER